MAKCRDPQDWTVLPSGLGAGSVSCGPYRGSYKTNSRGVVQITWTDGPEEGPHAVAIERAANKACARAEEGQMTKPGRLDAGG
ncbi:hypothetical protein KXR53_21255 [Inquilinus limosus]|uniref:hypothetical protein n=1 Tax=Inquilinus limosus TaxID=171674 RepID=UPI003F1906CC